MKCRRVYEIDFKIVIYRMGIENDNSTLEVFCFNLEFIKFVGVETIAFYFVTSRFDFLQDCYNFVLFLVLLYSLLIDETLQLRSIISNENNIFKYLIVCFWKRRNVIFIFHVEILLFYSTIV